MAYDTGHMAYLFPYHYAVLHITILLAVTEVHRENRLTDEGLLRTDLISLLVLGN